ncbi:gag-pol fusion protein [Pimephales promelas]|nr:gag-pol fusion protein [Pimephales promelas]
MALFDLQSFVEHPSLEQFDQCRKDDLLKIADHYKIVVVRQALKKDIKNAIFERLVEINIFSRPGVNLRQTRPLGAGMRVSSEGVSDEEQSETGAEVDVGAETKAVLPPFDPSSPASIGSGNGRLRVEAEKEVKLRQLELEALKVASGSAERAPRVEACVAVSPGDHSPAFDVSKHIALVPPFRETEVDTYFNAFERIASSLRWPKDVWSLLLQCKLVGKAQDVCSTLSLEESLQYDTVKSAILRAYELVPEAYRQRFRNHQKLASQTFVEFAREKGNLFDKWCNASKVTDFNSLRELLLLEEFKKCLPERVVVYLNEQKVNSLSQAAVLADEFVLTHKTVFSSARPEKNSSVQSTHPQPSRAKSPSPRLKEVRECFYCHKQGHVIADCLTLKRKQQQQQPSKSVGFVNSVMENTDDIAGLSCVDSGYSPFVLKGLISLTGKPEDQREIQMLRDTGAAHSFMVEDTLPLSEQSFCGSSILVQGIEMGFVKAPLHRVHLKSDLVTGFVSVGVRPSLPIKGVSFILGNDLAGGKVMPVLEVMDQPNFVSCDELSVSYPDTFPACVLTRAQAKRVHDVVDLSESFMVPVSAENVLPSENTSFSRGHLNADILRLDNSTLSVPMSRERIIVAQKEDESLAKCFASVISPDQIRQEKHVLCLAHDHVLSGHLGITKTYNRILKHFFWPGLKRDVVRFCRTCDTCQRMGKPNQVIPPAPLCPIPVMGEPFEHVLQSLSITHRVASAYHPESQGSLERFHQTLKSMLGKYCKDTGKDWDEGVPLMLFAVRETVQESLGFSPAELVFGHNVRGPLKLLKENLLGVDVSPKTNVLNYVSRFRERLHNAWAQAKESLTAAQKDMKRRYDIKAVPRSFNAGDQVLVLLPTSGSALSACFSGPYVLTKKLSETDYVVSTPDRTRKTRVCHINMLKAYHGREGSSETTEGKSVPVASSVAVAVEVSSSVETEADEDGLVLRNAPQQSTRLRNSELLKTLPSYLVHLSDDQRQDVIQLIKKFPTLFNDTPSRTSVLQHDIDVKDSPPIKQHAYRVNAYKRAIMREEVDYLTANGLAVPSYSPWSSPCVLVPKSDGTFRFCTDYRKVNAVTRPDCYPLPRMEDCIDNIGSARFVTKLDLLKGYWQVPLTSRASQISAFVTPDHLMEYKVMAFGLRNAPATFQRLVNLVLAGVPNCNAYLDDLVEYSSEWSEHLSLLHTVFERLEKATLTLNLAKCEFARATVTYLGKEVGQGQVRPVAAKVSAINEFSIPTTRRELRRFLGMAGYYRSFCRNFSSVVHPLTSLLSPSRAFVWSPECQHSFDSVKALLCSTPVLAAPDFALPFKLEVDASAVGAGAVLLQEDKNHVEHPVCYFFRKFNKHQCNYSTIEKEALALLLALQYFEVYIGSSPLPVIVYTDHNPLVFLSRMYNQNQRLMRWSLIVQRYNLEIRHKKGTENVVADALSRCA